MLSILFQISLMARAYTIASRRRSDLKSFKMHAQAPGRAAGCTLRIPWPLPSKLWVLFIFIFIFIFEKKYKIILYIILSGMSLPYSSSIPADDPLKVAECKLAGDAVLNLLKLDLKPRDIMTQKAFENAITLLMVLGGSTNAVLHLIAMARSVDVPLGLSLLSLLSLYHDIYIYIYI